LVSLHPTKERAREYITQALTGREGGVLADSFPNGIWCFTRDGRWMKLERVYFNKHQQGELTPIKKGME
jgi:hypothetical protein